MMLVEPTREMKREAAASGLFNVGFGDHPKIQILTVQELLAGGAAEFAAAGARGGVLAGAAGEGEGGGADGFGVVGGVARTSSFLNG